MSKEVVQCEECGMEGPTDEIRTCGDWIGPTDNGYVCPDIICPDCRGLEPPTQKIYKRTNHRKSDWTTH